MDSSHTSAGRVWSGSRLAAPSDSTAGCSGILRVGAYRSLAALRRPTAASRPRTALRRRRWRSSKVPAADRREVGEGPGWAELSGVDSELDVGAVPRRQHGAAAARDASACTSAGNSPGTPSPARGGVAGPHATRAARCPSANAGDRHGFLLSCGARWPLSAAFTRASAALSRSRGTHGPGDDGRHELFVPSRTAASSPGLDLPASDHPSPPAWSRRPDARAPPVRTTGHREPATRGEYSATLGGRGHAQSEIPRVGTSPGRIPHRGPAQRQAGVAAGAGVHRGPRRAEARRSLGPWGPAPRPRGSGSIEPKTDGPPCGSRGARGIRCPPCRRGPAPAHTPHSAARRPPLRPRDSASAVGVASSGHPRTGVREGRCAEPAGAHPDLLVESEQVGGDRWRRRPAWHGGWRGPRPAPRRARRSVPASSSPPP